MDYDEVLEKVSQKEISTAIIIAIVLAVIIGTVWCCHYFYFKGLRKKHPKKYSTELQIKIRRRSLWASIALTLICVSIGALSIYGVADTISDINKDIEENAYVAYTGNYYVHSDYIRRTLYDRWLSVTFDNGDYALLYMNSFAEWLSTEEGWFSGTVVYGRNSQIVVSIDN
ncbi:MAG: hypothetical protein IJ388_02410 [Oscillospiraceae bacterium]|nr:hypothetical protein [Oscillospiraceae bacterium]